MSQEEETIDSRVVPPPRRAFTRIRQAQEEISGVTEESDDEEPETGEIKVAAYNGGSKAEAWLDVLMNKLTPTQEDMFERIKHGTLDPDQLTRKQKRVSWSGSVQRICERIFTCSHS